MVGVGAEVVVDCDEDDGRSSAAPTAACSDRVQPPAATTRNRTVVSTASDEGARQWRKWVLTGADSDSIVRSARID